MGGAQQLKKSGLKYDRLAMRSMAYKIVREAAL